MIYYKVHQKNGVFLEAVITESNTAPKFCVQDQPPHCEPGEIARRVNGSWEIIKISELRDLTKETATIYRYNSHTGYFLNSAEIAKTSGYDSFLAPAQSTLTPPPHDKSAFDFELKEWAAAQKQAEKSTAFYNKRTKEKAIFYKNQYNKEEYTEKEPPSEQCDWNWGAGSWEKVNAASDADTEALKAHAWAVSELQKTDIMLRYAEEESIDPTGKARCKYDAKTIFKYRKELRNYTATTTDNGTIKYKLRHNNRPVLGKEV